MGCARPAAIRRRPAGRSRGKNEAELHPAGRKPSGSRSVGDEDGRGPAFCGRRGVGGLAVPWEPIVVLCPGAAGSGALRKSCSASRFAAAYSWMRRARFCGFRSFTAS